MGEIPRSEAGNGFAQWSEHVWPGPRSRSRAQGSEHGKSSPSLTEPTGPGEESWGAKEAHDGDPALVRGPRGSPGEGPPYLDLTQRMSESSPGEKNTWGGSNSMDQGPEVGKGLMESKNLRQVPRTRGENGS